MKNFGQALKEKRMKSQLSKIELAKKTGISYSRICDYENRNASTDQMEVRKLKAITDVLKWDISEAIKLIGGDDNA